MTEHNAHAGQKSLRALRQQNERGSLSPLVAAVMSSVDPGWAMLDSERRWRASAAAWGLHLKRTGTRPRLSGPPSEVKLARWEARQRDAHASGRLAPERERIMLLIETRELPPG